MALGLVSPGVLVREIDRTVGAVDASFSIVAGFAGPFAQGPVEDPLLITSESELIQIFGSPSLEDNHYEYWYNASDFLGYGGSLRLVRCDGDELKNSNAGVSVASTTDLKIKNFDDYQDSYSNETSWFLSAKDPGSWANGIKVCIIDAFADQRLGLGHTNPNGIGITVGYGITVSLSGFVAGAGTTSVLNGYLKAIIVGVNTDSVKTGTANTSFIDVKIDGHVSAAGTFTAIDYKENGKYLFSDNSVIRVTTGTNLAPVSVATTTIVSADDWYDLQTLGLSNSTVYWKNIADKPTTSEFSIERSGKNDQVHIVIIDDLGKISGISGEILEKNLFLSKGKDVKEQNVSVYYKEYLANNSRFLYAGKSLATVANNIHNIRPASTGFDAGTFTQVGLSDGDWGSDTQGIYFNGIGAVSLVIAGGKDYSTGTNQSTNIGGFEVQLDDLIPSYSLFEQDEFDINFIIGGPGLSDRITSQAKAIKIIDIATGRKDCIATISPFRGEVVNRNNISDARDGVLSFFAPLQSSSYVVFDSGYKYTYDRFNNEFIYIPLSADIAGLMVRTELNVYPWYSPAGVQRGNINNIIKLAYNPPQSHRDSLYKNRINPVISNPGGGFILFGDKTGLAYNSAFDRINVRRLFLVIEKAIKLAANTQLFEFNDSITRSTFVNIVGPYLRDVQAKRGITDFVVVCDDSNNPPDVIDRNEFIADIYIKPARSINFIGLTFVATRTGVSFSEIIGTV
jgi:hypothetical protein